MSNHDLSGVVRGIGTAPQLRKESPGKPTSVQLTVTIDDYLPICDVEQHCFRMIIQSPEELCKNSVVFKKGTPNEYGRRLASYNPTRKLGALLSFAPGVRHVTIENSTITLLIKHSWQIGRAEQTALRMLARNRRWDPSTMEVFCHDNHTATRMEQYLHRLRRTQHPEITFASVTYSGAEA